MSLFRFNRSLIYRVYGCTISSVSTTIESSSRNAKTSFMCCLRRNMNGMAKTSKENRAKVDSFVKALSKHGIKLMAIDFDKTLTDIHTGGVWDDSVDKLASHIRPCMRDLLESAASRKGLFVSIVTYHRQERMIGDVVHKLLPEKLARQILIQANSDRFLKRLKEQGISINGKEQHIASVVQAIKQQHGVVINKNEIILIDDDIKNIRVAISSGHFALQVQDNIDYSTFGNYEAMLSAK